MENFFRVFAVLMALKLGAFFVFSGYKTPWRFFSVQNLVNLVRTHILTYTLFGVLFIVFADVKSVSALCYFYRFYFLCVFAWRS